LAERFVDTLARSLVGRVPRRRLVGAAAGLAALVGGGWRPPSASARCTTLGRMCQANGDCCRGGRCTGGYCRCKRHWAPCWGTDKCFSLLHDWRNCGACGHICQGGAVCDRGTCI
jgi:hypothetical protein